MTEPAYPAARYVADKIQSHFALHGEAASVDNPIPLQLVPDSAAVESLIDAAFWTSLRREEQHPPRISLAYVPPELARPSLIFENPLLLSPGSLTKIAPGVERPGIHLGVWQFGDQLRVWGATRLLPSGACVVETVAPGLIVVKHRLHRESAKFTNIAVLEGDRVKILDHKFSKLPGCPTMMGPLLGFDFKITSSTEASNVLIRLAISMRSHMRGGLLLIVPNENTKWRDSISHPMSYSVHPPFNGLSELLRGRARDDNASNRWQDALTHSVDAIAGLTAIDGATVITGDFDVLAFGAKILRRRGSAPVEQVALVEPIEGSERQIVHPGELGGTRHLSAAQFAFDQRDSLAFAASQDGPFTIFSWAECEGMVYAYRVESLLL